jgi:transposase, IS6 family
MDNPFPFKWRHFEGDVFLLCVRWYLRYVLSSRDAERFSRNVLQASQTLTLRVITMDKNAAYPPAFETFQHDHTLPEVCLLRQCKYLNNMTEEGQRLVKHRVNPGLGFGAFHTAQRTI